MKHLSSNTTNKKRYRSILYSASFHNYIIDIFRYNDGGTAHFSASVKTPDGRTVSLSYGQADKGEYNTAFRGLKEKVFLWLAKDKLGNIEYSTEYLD